MQQSLSNFEASVKAEVDKMGAVVVTALISRLDMIEFLCDHIRSGMIQEIKNSYCRPDNAVFPSLWEFK